MEKRVLNNEYTYVRALYNIRITIFSVGYSSLVDVFFFPSFVYRHKRRDDAPKSASMRREKEKTTNRTNERKKKRSKIK